ncbi:MAG: HD domain-containing protein, partial [Chloroflexota bacterium]|nr:HD domain-containing protein [Chloroflexota bacterium]
RLLGTPLQGTSLSVSAAVAFATLLIFGPAAAIVVNSGSMVGYYFQAKRPFYKRLFTLGSLAISPALSGAVYVLAGGQSPLVMDSRNLIAATLAAATYFLTNASIVSGVVSLESGRPFGAVLGNWQWLFLQMLSTLAIGSMMALAFVGDMGVVGLLLFTLPLILPWYSIRVYVEKTKQLAEQNEQLKQANAGLEQANQILDRRLEELRALHEIGISLNSAQVLPAILKQILDSVVRLIGADASSIFLYNHMRKSLSIAGQVGLSDQYVAQPELALDGSAVRALREGRTLVVDTNNFVPAMLSGAAVRDGIRNVACLPLNVTGETVGALDVCFKSDHAFSEDELKLLGTLAEQAAVAIQNARLLGQVHEGYLSTISALAATVEAKDPYTRGHSEAVRRLAVATGRQLNLSAHEIELLNVAALFHDIGKIGISEAIINKHDQLTDEEWAVMREHPVIGERILAKVPALSDLLPIVRHHHERFDGTGYPDRIGSQEKPLAAIISLCDSYHAMTSDRPYRKSLSHHQALGEIHRCSGTQFVPELADAFIAAIGDGKIARLEVFRFEPTLLLHSQAHLNDGESMQPRFFSAVVDGSAACV